MLILVLCIIFRCIIYIGADEFQGTLYHLKPKGTPDVQTAAAKDVLKRLIGDKANLFSIKVDPSLGPEGKETFQIKKNESDEIVEIVATSGVGAAWGFHYYLKYYCFCHVSWDANQLALPEELPAVDLNITSPDRFRYYQNVCTTSYSFVWWDWQRWEKEIDWMALNGFNLALAFTGQEAIWKRVYEKLNLTNEEINEHFSGPAFLAWMRMGNMRGFGGPLSNAWHEQSLTLQHRILQRMRDLGIIPVLPAFAGHVPRAFKRLYPEAPMVEMARWNRFPDEYCCPYLLDPTIPLFKTIGVMFVSEMIAEFSTDHVYNCDTFNEMQPSNGSTSYLSAVSSSIYAAMAEADHEAVWLKQNWVFVNNMLFWTTDRVEAFITAVPLGKMIILDLQSELKPQYKRLNSYYGQPFIWCMLHNFGGTLGLYGAVENVNKGVIEGRSLVNGTMVGVGITPEGINQNYAMYDFMNEMGWRKESVNLTEWFSAYATRRYGVSNENASNAWQLLKSGVYNFTGKRKVRGKYVICRRPSLRLQPWSSVYNCTNNNFDMHGEHIIALRPILQRDEYFWYNVNDLAIAWDNLLDASTVLHNSPTYKHDLVDLSRQILQVLASGFYQNVVKAFKKGNIPVFQKNADNFLKLLNHMEILLASNKEFLLGTWLEAAKAMGTTPQEEQQYEYNARNQITLWGPQGEIVDYANKQWSGIVSHYFLPRWTLFLNALNFSLVNQTHFNQTEVTQSIFNQVEKPFTYDRSVFPVEPAGDSIVISRIIHDRWRPYFENRRFKRLYKYQTTLKGSTRNVKAKFRE